MQYREPHKPGQKTLAKSLRWTFGPPRRSFDPRPLLLLSPWCHFSFDFYLNLCHIWFCRLLRVECGSLLPLFFFRGSHSGSFHPQTTESASFRINQLRNATFVSPFV